MTARVPSSHPRLAVLAALLAATAARAQTWTPYVTGSAFGTVEATNVSTVVETEEGLLSQDEADVRTGYTLTAQAGVRWQTARTRTAAAYLVGVSTSGDLEVRAENVVQGLAIQHERTLSPRWQLQLADEFFWGIVRMEQDLGSLGFGGVGFGGGVGGTDAGDPDAPPGREVRPPRGAAAPRAPRSARPPQSAGGPTGVGGATGAGGLPTAEGTFAIHSIRYIRNGASAGLSYTPTFRWRHAGLLDLEVQYFLDQDVISDFRLRLFDTYSVGQSYELTWRPSFTDEYGLAATARTTWFDVPSSAAVEDPADPLAEEDGEAVATEAVGLTLSWRHVLNPFWFTELAGGVTTVFPLDDPGDRRDTAIGAAGIAHQDDRWLYRADVSRGISTSELGAVFAVTGLTLSAVGRLSEWLQVQLAANGARQDALIIVIRDDEDPADVNVDALQGWSVAATGQLGYVASRYVLITLAYGYDQRFSDDPDAGSQLSHRVLLGVTLGTSGAELGAERGGGSAVGGDVGVY